MFGSTERMDVAEVMSAIVEQACLYVPETPVGEMLKRPNVKIPKEAHTDSEKSYPKEAFTRAENVFAASSDLVRFQWKQNQILLASVSCRFANLFGWFEYCIVVCYGA